MKPPKKNLWAAVSALEGKRNSRADIMRRITPEEVAASIAIAIKGKRYDVEAFAEALDYSDEEAKRAIANLKALDGLTLRGKRSRDLDADGVIQRVPNGLAEYPEITGRVFG